MSMVKDVFQTLKDRADGLEKDLERMTKINKENGDHAEELQAKLDELKLCPHCGLKAINGGT